MQDIPKCREITVNNGEEKKLQSVLYLNLNHWTISSFVWSKSQMQNPIEYWKESKAMWSDGLFGELQSDSLCSSNQPSWTLRERLVRSLLDTSISWKKGVSMAVAPPGSEVDAPAEVLATGLQVRVRSPRRKADPWSGSRLTLVSQTSNLIQGPNMRTLAQESYSYVGMPTKHTSCVHLRPCLVSIQKLFIPSYRIFRHVHKALNID